MAVLALPGQTTENLGGEKPVVEHGQGMVRDARYPLPGIQHLIGVVAAEGHFTHQMHRNGRQAHRPHLRIARYLAPGVALSAEMFAFGRAVGGAQRVPAMATSSVP